jgi:hypothetical protein
MEKSAQLKSIFTVINERLLLDMITILCPVKIDTDDGLPKGICSSCLRIILDANRLRTKSVESDLKLRAEKFDIKIPEKVVLIKEESEKSPNVVMTFMDENGEGGGDDEEQEVEQPITKRLRIEHVHSLEHKKGPIIKDLNEKVKKYFLAPKENGGKWRCRKCKKNYAGGFLRFFLKI